MDQSAYPQLRLSVPAVVQAGMLVGHGHREGLVANQVVDRPGLAGTVNLIRSGCCPTHDHGSDAGGEVPGVWRTDFHRASIAG